MKFFKRLVNLMMAMVLTLPTFVNSQEGLNTQALVAVIQQGGYNLYFRHEATNWSQQDNVNQMDDWLSCDGSRIRQLSERGRQSALRTGQAMRSLNIPVSEVLASPYCRAMETAKLLDLGDVQASNDVINLRVAEFFGGRENVVATAQKLLAQPPLAGSNRVIVAHGNVAQAATPVYPGEGEMVVFKPDDLGHFTFVGRMMPEQWINFMQTK